MSSDSTYRITATVNGKILRSYLAKTGTSIKFTTNYLKSHIRSIQWDFGDNSSLSKQHKPYHRYKTSGLKTVTVTINSRYILKKTFRICETPKPAPTLSLTPVIPDPGENGILLRLINRSNSSSLFNVVIFQKNIASVDETAIAWLVTSLPISEQYYFVYDHSDLRISSSDTYGNFTPQLEAQTGQLFEVVDTPSGNVLQLQSPASDPSEIQVQNDSTGSINVHIYRNNKLLSQKTEISIGQKANFEFNPTFYIGVNNNFNEGDVIDSVAIGTFNTEISLFGIKTSDIIVTGGGSGPSSTPFSFSLENITF